MEVQKARKKPVEIEFVQFTGIESAEYIEEWSDRQVKYCVSKWQEYLSVNTLEGEMSASLNDYIVRGTNGEFYPVKPKIFHKTYEVVE